MDYELKTLPIVQLKLADDGNGSYSGYAATFGNIDDGGDRIHEGAFGPYLDEFVKDGFIAWQHEWDVLVATISDAREDKIGLWLSASFHSTVAAQDARTITSERLARGKSMGQSIGYRAREWDLTEEDGRLVRELLKVQPFESSLVSLPMNRKAGVDSVKGVQGFSDHLDRLMSDVQLLVDVKAGQVLSAANRGRLRKLLDALTSLEALRGDLDELLTSTEPKDDDDKSNARAMLANYYTLAHSVDALLAVAR